MLLILKVSERKAKSHLDSVLQQKSSGKGDKQNMSFVEELRRNAMKPENKEISQMVSHVD